MVLPLAADNRLENSVMYASSDTSKAVVDEYGKIAGKSAGSALITATAKGGADAVVKVEVSSIIGISTGISFNSSTINMKLGSTHKLTPNIEPYGTASKNVIYKSGKPDIVSVSHDGRLKALFSGSAVIKAVMEDCGKSVEVQVLVSKGAVLEGISFPTGQLILYEGKDEMIELNIMPKNAEYKSVTFVSNNIKAVKVQKVMKNTVLLKAVEQGFKTDVTAVIDDCIFGEEDPRCTSDISIYTLNNNPTVPLEKLSVVFPYDYSDLRGTYSITLMKGDVISPLSAVVFTPSNTTERDLKVTIENIDKDVLEVDSKDNCIIKAENYGKAKLTISSPSKNVKPVELYISVNATGLDYNFLPVNQVYAVNILDKKVLQNALSKVTLVPVEVKVSLKYKGFGYHIKDYRVESSNRDIIDIIDNRYIIAKNKGNAVITVISSDVKGNNGKGAKDIVEIEVR